MTDKLTNKQEAFAVAFVRSGNATEAYREAYDVEPNCTDHWLHVEACQLLSHPKIAPRIEGLREELKQAKVYTILAAADEFEEARKLAMVEKAPAAAVSAIKGKVDLFGLAAPTKGRTEIVGKDGGAIKTEETGGGAAKLAAVLEAIAERSGKAGEPPAE